jgi:hypothetical protein
MARPRNNVVEPGLGGHRTYRGVNYTTLGYVSPTKAKAKRVDPNVGREGYRPCEVCSYWVRERKDGSLRAHATDGGGYSVRRGDAPCLGATPTMG